LEWLEYLSFILLILLLLKAFNLFPKKRKKRGRRKPSETGELKGETIALLVRLPIDIYQKLSEENEDVGKQIVLHIERLIREQKESETNG